MAMTKAEAALLAASQVTTQRVALVAATYEAWITAQDTESTAILALLASHKTSKSPARVLVAADARYAVIETDAPQVTSITPATGVAAGGTAVSIVGKDLTGATVITLGGTTLTSKVVVNDTHLTGVTPAKTAGAYDLVVTTPSGTVTKTNFYTYT